MANPSSVTPMLTLVLLLVGGCANQEREALNTDSDGRVIELEDDGTSELSDAVEFDVLIDPQDIRRAGADSDGRAELVESNDTAVGADMVDPGDAVSSADVEGSDAVTVEYWAEIFATGCLDFQLQPLTITQATPVGVANACVDDESQRIMAGLPDGIDVAANECGFVNLGLEDTGVCTLFCLADRTGLSRTCSSCYALKFVCQIDECLTPCAADPLGDWCSRCSEEAGCTARFNDCYGGVEGE